MKRLIVMTALIMGLAGATPAFASQACHEYAQAVADSSGATGPEKKAIYQEAYRQCMGPPYFGQ